MFYAAGCYVRAVGAAEQTQELVDQVCSLEKQLEQARLEV